MEGMLGLDERDCAAYAEKRLDWKRCKDLQPQAAFLCPALVAGQVSYLHACGALDESVAVDGAAELKYDEEQQGWYMGERLETPEAVRGALEEAGAFGK